MTVTPEDVARFTADGVVLSLEDARIKENWPDSEAVEYATMFDYAEDAQLMLNERFSVQSLIARPHEMVELRDRIGLGTDVSIAPAIPGFIVVDADRAIADWCVVRAYSFLYENDRYAVELCGFPPRSVALGSITVDTTYTTTDDGIVRVDRTLALPVPVKKFTAAQKAIAQKIHAAATGYQPRATMKNPPVLTQSAANAPSTIRAAANRPFAPQFNVLDERVRKTGPIRQAGSDPTSGFVGNWATVADGSRLDGGSGFGFAITTTAPQVEFAFAASANVDKKARIRVNGEWMTAGDVVIKTAPPNFNRFYAKFDFGSAAERTIEIFLPANSVPYGFNVADGHTITTPPVPGGFSGVMYGDSFVYSPVPLTSADAIRSGTICQRFGEVMGMNDIIPSARGGQGYVRVFDGNSITSRMKIDAKQLPSTLEAVFLYGSVNDTQATPAQIRSAMATAVLTMQEAYPAALIFVFSSFDSNVSSISMAQNQAFKDGATLVADSRTIIIDTRDAGLAKIAKTGTLPNGRPNDSQDDLHPGPNQAAYNAERMKKAVITELRRRIAIS